MLDKCKNLNVQQSFINNVMGDPKVLNVNQIQTL